MDRCCGPLHCLALKGRHCAAVVTSGGGGCDEVEAYLLGFLRHMGSWTVGSVGATAATLMNPADRPKAVEAAGAFGRAMVAAIAQGRTYPEQLPEQNAFAQRMRQLVNFRKDQWPHEYNLWKSRGWL